MPQNISNAPHDFSICFIYNHDAPHQVAHTAPVVNALAQSEAGGKIAVAYSSDIIKRNILRHFRGDALERVEFFKLDYPAVFHALDFFNKLFPYSRLMNLVGSKKRLAEFDCFVTPETTSLFLKKHLGLGDKQFVFIPHGAGDRSIGFRKDAQGFDLVLVSGEKTRRRFCADAGVAEDKVQIIGYPKFDAFHQDPVSDKPLFANDKPVVLYNPHFDPMLSSWYEHGMNVLEFFAENTNYNLIFAPHIMLFKKKLHASVEHGKKAVRKDIPARFYECPNIHIDVDSDNLIDMTYTKSADIYMGDASSQIYEFIYRPRPAVFLCNSNIEEWAGDRNFRHWELGPVVRDINDLASTFDQASKLFQSDFEDKQKLAFNETFSSDKGPASSRAAKVLSEFMKV